MKQKYSLSNRIDKANSIFAVGAGILIIMISLAITINALARYFFGITSIILLEFTEYSLLWMTFLGTAWVAKRDGHISVDLLISLMGPSARRYLNILALIVGTLLFFVIFCCSAYVTYGDYKANLILQTIYEPRKWIIEIIIPIGTLLLFLQLLMKVLNISKTSDLKE